MRSVLRLRHGKQVSPAAAARGDQVAPLDLALGDHAIERSQHPLEAL